MGCVGPALVDESRGRDGETRTHPGLKGWRGTECTGNGQPPDARRIAWFEQATNRASTGTSAVCGRNGRPFDAGPTNPDNGTRN
jgi:hypothetical protein